jgi:hypothetical protein
MVVYGGNVDSFRAIPENLGIGVKSFPVPIDEYWPPRIE